MYILIENEPLKVLTFEAKTDLAKYLGIHVNTVRNRFEHNTHWNSKKGIVYQSNKHHKRLRKGNRDSLAVKIAGKRL